MLTPRVFVRVLILILFEFFFGCRCAEPPNQLKRCYDVGYNTFCFFRPDSGYKRMTWAKAYQTCRRNNATLPTIPSEAAQAAFEEYLKFLKLVFDYDCWMAGQEVREREWKWLNDRTSNLTVRQLTGNTSSDYVQGVLQHDMSYRTDTPSHINHFICQLKGMACRSNRTIPLGKDCILADITEALNLYDARNKCVKEGGDLLEIDNSGDLDILREIITRIPNVNKVWIGLRRQWWAWNATESAVDMKYSNWLPNHGFKPNRRCMITEMKGYKWKQEFCNNSRRFVCQIVATTPPISIPESISLRNPIFFIIFAALGIFVLVVPITIVMIVKKKRKASQRPSDVMRVTSDRSYQDLQERQENQYTGLHLMTRPQTELNPDYVNLSVRYSIGGTRVPA